jgi:hypothetical protein
MENFPPAPKKPINGYMKYRATVYNDLVKANPEKKMIEITPLVSAGWNNLPESEKAKFNASFEAETKTYKTVSV